MSRTADQVKELRALLNDASERPWNSHDFGYPGEQEPSSIVIFNGPFDWEALAHGEHPVIAATGWDRQESDDVRLICTAVNTLPSLLDKLTKVEALYERYANSAGFPADDCAELLANLSKILNEEEE